MTTFDFAGTSTLDPAHSTAKPRSGVALVQLHDELWRVTRPDGDVLGFLKMLAAPLQATTISTPASRADGDVLGYVESFLEPRGHRYRSKRLIPLQRRFINIGEFWSFDDAVDCLRFG